MAHLVAVANQKGGVAKTTTVHSLGYALAAMGRRVLMVDLDPQGDLTFSVGIDATMLKCTIHDVLAGQATATETMLPLGVQNLALLPATFDLTVSEVDLAARVGREYALSRALAPLHDSFDFVLIDSPPSLGILTINALTAAHEVLIPCQCETLGDRGVAQLLELVADVRMFTNSSLGVRGIVATMYDRHTLHNRFVLTSMEQRHGVPVLDPPVRKSVRFAEASQRGRCILQWAPSSPGADAYRRLAVGIDSPSDQAAALEVGTPVFVRDRFQGDWTNGFGIAGTDGAQYILRRVSDGSILPGRFGPGDLRTVADVEPALA
jgi:chromosome partitioning protein